MRDVNKHEQKDLNCTTVSLTQSIVSKNYTHFYALSFFLGTQHAGYFDIAVLLDKFVELNMYCYPH